jgi:hypothetical protein
MHHFTFYEAFILIGGFVATGCGFFNDIKDVPNE